MGLPFQRAIKNNRQYAKNCNYRAITPYNIQKDIPTFCLITYFTDFEKLIKKSGFFLGYEKMAVKTGNARAQCRFSAKFKCVTKLQTVQYGIGLYPMTNAPTPSSKIAMLPNESWNFQLTIKLN